MSLGLQLVALSAVAVVLSVFALWTIFSFRITPEKRERRRRLAVNTTGRLGDALITEASDETLYYTYSLRGVTYAASQDITTLRDRLPGQPDRLVGATAMKYSTRNPANSILLCEEWSGLRAASLHGDAERPQPQDAAMGQTAQR
jgi:hypothetical protein